jgi:hypothetical protein
MIDLQSKSASALDAAAALSQPEAAAALEATAADPPPPYPPHPPHRSLRPERRSYCISFNQSALNMSRKNCSASTHRPGERKAQDRARWKTAILHLV